MDTVTKEELLRDVCVFYANHRDERLFRYDIFAQLMKETHGVSSSSNMNDWLTILRDASTEQCCELLRKCRNASTLSDQYDKLLTRPALLDLHELIDYAKHCNEK